MLLFKNGGRLRKGQLLKMLPSRCRLRVRKGYSMLVVS